jgi:branched-chain amino acid transport system permease protein
MDNSSSVQPAIAAQDIVVPVAAVPRVGPSRESWLTPRGVVGTIILVVLALVPLYSQLAHQPFYLALFGRVVIYAVAAVSLNLLVGYCGLVSFGHALFFGLGAYAVGILAHYDVDNGWIQLAATIVVCGVVGLLSGLVVLRTTGIAFIMITLAFAQMFYFLAVSLNEFGGDDGSPVLSGSNFGFFKLDNAVQLYYVSFVVLLAVLFGMRRLIESRFGMVIRGTQANERRMKASGFSTLPYKLTAYVIAAIVCGVAGMLIANLTSYISPSYMAWTTSGEMVVMVVLGGLGTLMGPVAGAVALLIIEEVLKSQTEHWMLVLGFLIVVVVMVSRRGIFGNLRGRV